MAMAASLIIDPRPSSFLTPPHRNHRKPNHFQINSQSFRDEGKSANNNVVDANLGVLRERISQVKFKERMDRYNNNNNNNNSRREKKKKIGWEYQRFGYDPNLRKQAIVSVSMEIMGLVTGSLGFVFFTGSLCIYLVSLLAQINK